ncbi:MAG: hypothetical protein ACKO7P_10015 [Bacteroidota bacterium]
MKNKIILHAPHSSAHFPFLDGFLDDEMVFGPNHDRFPEAEVFLNNRIAFEFKDAFELETTIKEVLQKGESFSLEIQNLVQSFTGASQLIVNLTDTESN